jgi:hypothetical protein
MADKLNTRSVEKLPAPKTGNRIFYDSASKVNTNARIIPDFQRKKEPFTNSVSATTTYENGKNLIIYQRETGDGALRKIT